MPRVSSHLWVISFRDPAAAPKFALAGPDATQIPKTVSSQEELSLIEERTDKEKRYSRRLQEPFARHDL
jgi:hypothetical protein